MFEEADETGAAAATHTHTDRRGLGQRAETLALLLLGVGERLRGRLRGQLERVRDEK